MISRANFAVEAVAIETVAEVLLLRVVVAGVAGVAAVTVRTFVAAKD